MMTAKEILETISKDQLIDIIIEYGSNGWFPLEVFLLRADCDFTAEELKFMWEHCYEQAYRMERKKIDFGADLLRDAAEACFKYAKRFQDAAACNTICRMLVDDMRKACVEDGIGMYGDSEWIYLGIREQIAEYIGVPADDI